VAQLTAEQAVLYRLDSIHQAEAARTALEAERRLNQERIAEERLVKVNAVEKQNQYLLIILILIGVGAALLVYFLRANLRARKQIEVQAQQLQEGLQEKEMLMRELHHRVKNNLQSVASMLQLQRRRSGDEAVRGALSDSLLRISTISGLHDLLHAQRDLEEVDATGYIRNLAGKVMAAYLPVESLDVDLRQIRLHDDQLLFLGFIVNEWLTNAFKYSTAKEQLRVKIYGTEQPTGKIEIQLHENGKGYDPEVENDGFGLKLMQSLAQRMQGELTFDAQHNITFLRLQTT
ncbi:MAG: sensor histidine kinase, partial [Bacteroidota bacterium]